MKILVTGHSGYIGSKLFEALKDKGHEVYGVDIKQGTTIANTFFRGIDVVFHLAAQTDVQYSRKQPLYDAMNNIVTTIEVINKYPDARIIYAASAASLEPNSPYGLSKKVCEEYIDLLHANNTQLRIPNPWGDGGHGVVDYFLTQDTLMVNGDGLQTRTIVHVNDIVRAFVMALDWENGKYSLGGDDKFNLSVKEIAERISKKTGAKVEYNKAFNPKKQGEVYAAIIPNTTPNWKPEIELC